MTKKIIGNVNLRHPDTHDIVTLLVGDDVPEWAESLITNPAVVADLPDAPLHSDNSESEESGAPVYREVQERAKELGVKASGTADAILERIAAAEAAQVVSTKPTEDESRAGLERKARELGITFTAETTDSELEALIDTQE